MKKYIIFLFIFFFNINAQSSSNQKIINHLENIDSLQFKFTQRIDNNHSEIAYFGILEEYFGKKCGGYLLSEAIKKLFDQGVSRVWLHTCSLDHENAIKNYLARGMQVFKSEKINVDLN